MGQRSNTQRLTNSITAGPMGQIAAALIISLSASAQLDLPGENSVRRRLDNEAQKIYQAASRTPDRNDWFSAKPFIEMIENHERFIPEFTRWRRLFARHAGELARLLKSLPGSEDLTEAHLRGVIAQPEITMDSSHPVDVFKPWTGHWSGMWSNEAAQYHVWDSTRLVGGQWLQPVSLSETEFVEADHVEEMVRSHRTDVAINFYSRQNGITGWVSKRQHQRVEIPHVGYLVNDTTLVWICQIKQPDKLFSDDSTWFVFIETVSASNRSERAEYRIQGLRISVTDGNSVEVSQRGMHYGTYYAAPSAAMAEAADYGSKGYERWNSN